MRTLHIRRKMLKRKTYIENETACKIYLVALMTLLRPSDLGKIPLTTLLTVVEISRGDLVEPRLSSHAESPLYILSLSPLQKSDTW